MKKLIGFLAVLLAGQLSLAANYFVMDTIAQGVSDEDADALTSLVRNSVSSMPGEVIVENRGDAEFVLQPRLSKLADSYILTVEKIKDDQVIHSNQQKVGTLSDLDRTARRSTVAALNESTSKTDRAVAGQASEEKPMESGTTAGATSPGGETRGEAQAMQPAAKDRYWTVGIGPAWPSNLETGDVMYHIIGGHLWNLTPQAAVKVLGEANFATNDDAFLYNVGAGGNYYFMQQRRGSAYVTADIGFGGAETENDDTANGFSFGAGIGYQIARTATDRNLDVLLRYTVLTDDIGNNEDFPSVFGASLALNF